MNKEYFLINDNFYGVINENDKLNIILTNTNPEQCLTKQNELENLNLIKNNNINKINELVRKRKRKILGTLLYSGLCIVISNFSLFIYLEIIISISILELITKGSYKKISKEINDLNKKNNEIAKEIEFKNKEVKQLEEKIDYKNISFNNYSNNYTNDNIKVKKLILKKDKIK